MLKVRNKYEQFDYGNANVNRHRSFKVGLLQQFLQENVTRKIPNAQELLIRSLQLGEHHSNLNPLVASLK